MFKSVKLLSKSQARWPGRNARPNVFCTMSFAHVPNMRPGRVLVNIVMQFHIFVHRLFVDCELSSDLAIQFGPF